MTCKPLVWEPVGRLYTPQQIADWGVTHAALPVLDPHEPFMYFSPRDRQNRAHIARCRVWLDTCTASEPEETPVLTPGALGAFDDGGVTTSCVVAVGDERRLYYTGWMRGVSVPFYLAVGLATSPGGTAPFERTSPAPLLDRSGVDPYLTASPWVIRDGGMWRMWYVSGTGWDATPRGPHHRYHIRYAESPDGIAWRRRGAVAVDFASADEYAFGRPCVIKDNQCYRMWYCYRGAAYRLGYAESGDGLSWMRRDELAGDWPAGAGFDDEMRAYPAVHDRAGVRWMLYNGNAYGGSGVGLARTHSGHDA